jgi:hypothetical protein
VVVRVVRFPQPFCVASATRTIGGPLPVPALTAFGIGGFALLYVLLFLFLGIRSIKHGHWIMFLLGIPFPIFWLIGGLMPPVER